MCVLLPVMLMWGNNWGWEASSSLLCGVLEMLVVMAVPGFGGKGVYSLRQKMLRGLWLKGSGSRWLWAVRNVTYLSCKALSSSLFKVQADHMVWRKYGSEGVKGLRGFSCPSKSEKHSAEPKRTTPRWRPSPLPLETQRGVSLPHDGTFSPNSE